MKKFPKIKESEFVLIRIEASTGIVLDESLKYDLSPEQKVCTVFSDLKDLLQECKKIIENHENVDCGIYKSNEEFLYNISSLEQVNNMIDEIEDK